MKTESLYETVTANILAELEAGAIPWLQNWKPSSGGLLPANAITKRSYSGINIPILWYTAKARQYERHLWLTFQQALAAGANVRKGERGTHVVFAKPITFKDRDTAEEKKIRLLKTFSVFNVAQVDGLELEPEPPPPPERERHEAADRFIKATNAQISYGGDKACYIPQWDAVCMPHPGAFADMESFYSTSFHELGHWTGAKHRLERDITGSFKSKAYSFEELVAELTAAFLCAHLGIRGELRHAGYIEHYMQVLKDDDKAFFKAAAKAQQAADFLRSFSEHKEMADALVSEAL